MLNMLDKDCKEVLDERTYCSTPDCLGEPWCSAWNVCKEKNLDSLFEEAIRHPDFDASCSEQCVPNSIPTLTRPFSAIKTDDEV